MTECVAVLPDSRGLVMVSWDQMWLSQNRLIIIYIKKLELYRKCDPLCLHRTTSMYIQRNSSSFRHWDIPGRLISKPSLLASLTPREQVILWHEISHETATWIFPRSVLVLSCSAVLGWPSLRPSEASGSTDFHSASALKWHNDLARKDARLGVPPE